MGIATFAHRDDFPDVERLATLVARLSDADHEARQEALDIILEFEFFRNKRFPRLLHRWDAKTGKPPEGWYLMEYDETRDHGDPTYRGVYMINNTIRYGDEGVEWSVFMEQEVLYGPLAFEDDGV